MLIVNEISFASSSDLLKLHESLCKIKQVCDRYDRYGGLDMIFSGDFSQLEPGYEWNSIVLSTQFCTVA